MNAREERRSTTLHSIRLGSQWEVRWLPQPPSGAGSESPAAAKPLQESEPQRLKTIAAWPQVAIPEPRGRIQLVRRFGLPTGLTPHQGLELVIDGLPPTAQVSVNDRRLAPRDSGGATAPVRVVGLKRFELTGLLKARNSLAIEFDAALGGDERAECFRDVRLEIKAVGPGRREET